MSFVATATSFIVFVTLISLLPEALGRRFLPLPPSPNTGCGIHHQEFRKPYDCGTNHFPPPPPASGFTSNSSSSLPPPPPSESKSALPTPSYDESTSSSSSSSSPPPPPPPPPSPGQ
ncbi:hypothetical protein RGQ29_002703 [Quercus rubra]|uniref:Uncharacterized protein n=1 Tax=Quercus rubra TaxID=3512 RepID=A0AAN7EAS7_QUERU|nr:hypothetical protein RGQ29_002703 [Quercus rubra]